MYGVGFFAPVVEEFPGPGTHVLASWSGSYDVVSVQGSSCMKPNGASAAV